VKSLRSSLIVAVVVPLALATTLAGILVLRELEERAVERMEEDVELVARAIRLPLSRALERERVQGAVDALQSAFEIGRVYGAYLYDEEGRLVSAFGRASGGEDPDRVTELAEEEDRRGEYGRTGPEEVYSYFVPLTSGGGRPIGLLQVTRRRSDIQEHVDALRLRVGGSLFAGLVLMTGLVLVGHRRAVGRHLERLLGSMSRVEAGDRAHRPRLDGPREIARLGSGLARMLDSIARAEEEVKEHREEQLRLERELRRSEKMAAVGRLGAGVAHELGTPLSAVDARAQRLLRRSELSERTRNEVEAIRGEVDRMEGIVRQLLDFGRGLHGPRRAVPGDRLARSAAGVHRDEARAAGVTLHVEGPEPPPVLHVDAGGMERALGNLIRNGIQAARSRVTVEWFGDEGDEAGFRVRDDGEGIDPEVAERIFEPFFTTKPTGSGTGLGLSVVHGIVEEHGGRVRVRSASGGGAEFEVVLPLKDAGDLDPSPDDTFEEGGRGEGDGGAGV